jgi:uncharacterized protein (DUF934 family)
MMALIKERQLVDDPFVHLTDDDEVPAHGPVIVSLSAWKDRLEQLAGRDDPVGVRLKSDEHPESIADDLDRIALVALEFPVFRDGRAYSYARLLRERYGFEGELRAVGDVLLEQIHYMERVGFNAFEFNSANPEKDFAVASRDFSAWYQPSGDERRSAPQLRHRSDRKD